jgi:hypothetical protein
VDDWFKARQYPQAFGAAELAKRSARWHEAQMVLTKTFHALQLQCSRCPWTSGK